MIFLFLGGGTPLKLIVYMFGQNWQGLTRLRPGADLETSWEKTEISFYMFEQNESFGSAFSSAVLQPCFFMISGAACPACSLKVCDDINGLSLR